MSYINKIRERVDTSRLGRGSSSSVGNKELPLDHQLTFKREADEEWTFKNGHIYVNDVEIDEVVSYESKDVRLWCGISGALMEYKDVVMSKTAPNKSKFLASVDALQGKVLDNMKRLYDEKTNGFHLSLGDGEILFNNFNVRAFLAMYHMRPTTKARQFLMGLKSKLALILVNRSCTHGHERVRRLVQQLYEEVISALEVQPITTHRIAAPSRDQSL